MDSIGIALIGAGNRGKTHLRVFRHIEGVSLVGVYDVEPIKSLEVSKEFNIKRYSSLNELLNDNEVDAVIIATPDYTHAQITLEALKHGKHVLCETPMAYTYSEVFEIIKEVERNNVVYVLGNEVRFWPIFRKVKEMNEKRVFGKIFYAETEYLHNIEDLIKRTLWRKKQTTILGGGVHAIDILRWIVGEFDEVITYGLKTIEGQMVDDFTISIFRSRDNVIARVLISYGIKRTYSLSIRVYGTKASFEQDTFPWSCESGVFFRGPNKAERIRVPSEEVPIKSHGVADYLQAKNFIKAIEGKEKPYIDVYDAAKTTIMCIAAVESLYKGKSVKIPKLH